MSYLLLLHLCCVYFEFNKLKIQIVVTLVFDISIFNDVNSVCVLVSFFFVLCVFIYKYVLDKELLFFFFWKMRSEREGNIRGTCTVSGVAVQVWVRMFLVLRGKEFESALIRGARWERESFECNAKLDLAIQYWFLLSLE